jgi:hypothetical protein
LNETPIQIPIDPTPLPFPMPPGNGTPPARGNVTPPFDSPDSAGGVGFAQGRPKNASPPVPKPFPIPRS